MKSIYLSSCLAVKPRLLIVYIVMLKFCPIFDLNWNMAWLNGPLIIACIKLLAWNFKQTEPIKPLVWNFNVCLNSLITWPDIRTYILQYNSFINLTFNNSDIHWLYVTWLVLWPYHLNRMLQNRTSYNFTLPDVWLLLWC